MNWMYFEPKTNVPLLNHCLGILTVRNTRIRVPLRAKRATTNAPFLLSKNPETGKRDYDRNEAPRVWRFVWCVALLLQPANNARICRANVPLLACCAAVDNRLLFLWRKPVWFHLRHPSKRWGAFFFKPAIQVANDLGSFTSSRRALLRISGKARG